MEWHYTGSASASLIPLQLSPSALRGDPQTSAGAGCLTKQPVKAVDRGLSKLQVAVIYFKSLHFLRSSKSPSSFKISLCWAEYKVTLNLRHTTHTPEHVLLRVERRRNCEKMSCRYSDLSQARAIHAVSSSAHAVLPSWPFLPLPRLQPAHPFWSSPGCYTGNFWWLHNHVIIHTLASSSSCSSSIDQTHVNRQMQCPHFPSDALSLTQQEIRWP